MVIQIQILCEVGNTILKNLPGVSGSHDGLMYDLSAT
jgi:hypothetical protein